MHDFTVTVVNAQNNLSLTKEYEISTADFERALEFGDAQRRSYTISLDDNIHGLALRLAWDCIDPSSRFVRLKNAKICASRSSGASIRLGPTELITDITMSDDGRLAGSWVAYPAEAKEVVVYSRSSLDVRRGQSLRIELRILSAPVIAGAITSTSKVNQYISGTIDSSVSNDVCFLLYKRHPRDYQDHDSIGLVYASKAALIEVSSYFESCALFKFEII
jgi:hypothetical protein